MVTKTEEDARAHRDALLAVIQDAIVSMDHQGLVIEWNPAAETIFGYARAEATGKELASLIIPERLRERHRRGLRTYLVTGKGPVLGKLLELPAVRKDGTEFMAEVFFQPFRERGRQMFIGQIRDITERLQTQISLTRLLEVEKAARSSAERARQNAEFLATVSGVLWKSLDYQTTLDQVAHLVVPFLADWCCIDVIQDDGQLRQLAMAHRNRDKEERARELGRRHPQDPGAPRLLSNVLRTGKSDLRSEIPDALLEEISRSEEHLQFIRSLGLKSYLAVPLEARGRLLGVITLVTDESGRHFSAADLPLFEELGTRAAMAIDNARLFRDARQSDQALRALNAALENRVNERTEQLETLNREMEAFSYSVSHDLRAPLRAMDGFSQALLEDYGDVLDETGRSYLQFVRSASQNMAQLIDDLLKLSRVTRVELAHEPVDLGAIARTIAAELALTQPERQVEWRIADGLETIGDMRLLRIALENLVGNAWKFSAQRERAVIEVGATDTDTERTYFVRDNGAGFDMAYVDKLFRPFSRLHGTEEFPGTGIGLVTAQRIIRRHGGRIWAEAAVNEGATFFFTLGE